MNNNKVIKYGIIAFGWLVVLYPLWVRWQNVYWGGHDLVSLSSALFPFLGLAAAGMLWLHSVSGVFEPWLRQYINFDRFVGITARLIFICFALHPVLLWASVDFSISNIFLYYGLTYIWVGIVAWILLVTYDIIKPFKKHDVVAKHWTKVLVVSNIGFLLTFLHSLNLGSNLQTGPLRMVWMLYGITATLAIVYTYAVIPFLKKK